MSSLIPFTFNTVELKVVTVEGKQWCRAKEVCKALEYQRQTAKVIKDHCSGENSAQKYELSGRSATDPPVNWPSDSQKYDLYINEEGLYELVFSSQQPLAKEFRKHCCNVMFPHIQQQIIDKMEKEITDQDNKIQAIQYENVGLQGEVRAKNQQIARCENRIQDLIERHVPRRGVIDTVLSLIDKQCENEPHKFYMIRCQYKALNKHKKWLRKRYPNMIEKGESDDPNAVHRWCSFKKDFF